MMKIHIVQTLMMIIIMIILNTMKKKINDQPVEVEYKEENTSNDYNDNVSEKNDEDIERKRMLEEYFADQDGKDSKAKRTKTRGKHF